MWQGERRSHLPPDWERRRKATLQRDRTCQIARPRICTVRSTEVDHIQRGNDHSESNLRGVCRNCHMWKSSREGHDAKNQRKQRIKRVEDHPGVINDASTEA